jgi:hypothetical protein
MMNSNIDLTSEILAIVAKLYPNGTTLTVHNGITVVNLPLISQPMPKVKKVLPNIKVKPVPEGSLIELPSSVIGQIPMYLNDAGVYWEQDNRSEDNAFYVSSKQHGLTSITLDVQEEHMDYLIGMLRAEGEETEDLEFEVLVHYENGNIISAEYVY